MHESSSLHFPRLTCRTQASVELGTARAAFSSETGRPGLIRVVLDDLERAGVRVGERGAGLCCSRNCNGHRAVGIEVACTGCANICRGELAEGFGQAFGVADWQIE